MAITITAISSRRYTRLKWDTKDIRLGRQQLITVNHHNTITNNIPKNESKQQKQQHYHQTIITTITEHSQIKTTQ